MREGAKREGAKREGAKRESAEREGAYHVLATLRSADQLTDNLIRIERNGSAPVGRPGRPLRYSCTLGTGRRRSHGAETGQSRARARVCRRARVRR
jgi:hypothetical protein